MPKLNLGRVVGRDGGFGNITTVYVNDGGAPSVTIDATGEDHAKDFQFTFANLVRDPATIDEVDQIAKGEKVQSSNVITVAVECLLWAKMKENFAAKVHKHSASDITEGTLDAARIAEKSISKSKLDQSLQDSMSQVLFNNTTMSVEIILSSPANGPQYRLAISRDGIGIWRGGYNGVSGAYEWRKTF